MKINNTSALIPSLRVNLAEIITSNWRRQWHPTPVLLPGKSHGQRSLEGCSPWGRIELDTTERLNWTELTGVGKGRHSFQGASLLCSPFAWKSTKATLSFSSILLHLYISVQHWYTERQDFGNTITKLSYWMWGLALRSYVWSMITLTLLLEKPVW